MTETNSPELISTLTLLSAEVSTSSVVYSLHSEAVLIMTLLVCGTPLVSIAGFLFLQVI